MAVPFENRDKKEHKIHISLKDLNMTIVSARFTDDSLVEIQLVSGAVDSHDKKHWCTPLAVIFTFCYKVNFIFPIFPIIAFLTPIRKLPYIQLFFI